jgi:hypothetical protein
MRTFVGLVILLKLAAPLRADLHFPLIEAKLGDAYSGRPLGQRFTFTNKGPTVVSIQRLSASCGCMTPRLDKLNYQPGESGSFVLEVNTLTQPVGPNLWHVDVIYTDGDQPRQKELLLRANLHREINVEPAKLALSSTGPISHDIRISDSRPLPLHITLAQTSSPHLATQVIKETDGRSYRIHLMVKDSLPVGRHEEMLGIITDDPGYRELRIPVTINRRLRTGVTATPASVTLTIPPGQPAPSRVVLLRGENEQEVIVDRIETDNPALTCRWAAGPGKMATLRISAVAPAGALPRGIVRVHLKKPSVVTVTIPVVCTTP